MRHSEFPIPGTIALRKGFSQRGFIENNRSGCKLYGHDCL